MSPHTRWLVGWGLRAAAERASFASCWAQACSAVAGLGAGPAPITFAVLPSRMQTPAWQALLAWQASAVPQAECLQIAEAEINHAATPHQSSRLLQRFGTGSVCEALAWCAACRLAGPQAIHWALPRIVSADRRATLAVAVLAPAGLPPTPTLTSGVPS
ncbi:cobalamin biosynthesis protein [Comamonas sp. J-3]|jgi:hypothetical protein|uniref:cobalamin biosynthesis protein n=1 Tax=Comamonas trifloxystrobinivorans TaxID=3350256 RepID=UPI00372B333B